MHSPGACTESRAIGTNASCVQGATLWLPMMRIHPDLTVGEDDIVFLDFGPAFEEWEADFGRTYVVGKDPLKHTLRRDIEDAFANGKQYFREHPEITAAELYAHAQQWAERAGWEYGGPIAGHLIGIFPHEKISGDKVTLYVHPKNRNRMRMPDASGRERHWILEIHFVGSGAANRWILHRIVNDRVKSFIELN
jgi:Xaa-Pro dipeptidase